MQQYAMKTKVTISMDMESHKWIKSMVAQKRFGHVSHGVEYCVRIVKEQNLVQ